MLQAAPQLSFIVRSLLRKPNWLHLPRVAGPCHGSGRAAPTSLAVFVLRLLSPGESAHRAGPPCSRAAGSGTPQHGRLVTEPMVVGLHHCYRRCAQGEEPCTLLAVWASRSASAPGRNNTPWGMIESRGPTIAGKPSQRRPPPRTCRSLYHPSGMKTVLERVRTLVARDNGRLKEAKIRCQPGCILMGRPRVRSDKFDARGDP